MIQRKGSSNKDPNNFNKDIPFYFSNGFIATLFIFWPVYGIPLIAGIVLLIMKNKKYTSVPNECLEKINDFNELDLKIIDLKNKHELNKKEAEEQINKIDEEYKTEKNKMIRKIGNEIEELVRQKTEIEKYIIENYDEALFKQTMVEFNDDVDSSEIKSQLTMQELYEKNLIKEDLAINYKGSSLTKTEHKKQARQLLRSFNSEVDYYLSQVTAKNVDSYRKKIANSFDTLNNMFKIDDVQISKNLLESKLKRLDIIYKHQQKITQEKELMKAKKEEIREQQKVEKELRDARRKVEKEESQFSNEISKLVKYLSKSDNDIERNIYADKIKELEAQLASVREAKKDIESRELNTRAGFVYIISNIGSFGENIYKIGLTRRLEPMDRINELSSASVPFPFDEHAIIFSDDAQTLENTLHNYFRDREVNKVNPRKEFFKVNLDEIEELVHKEHNNTVIFKHEHEAEQYYETIQLEKDS